MARRTSVNSLRAQRPLFVPSGPLRPPCGRIRQQGAGKPREFLRAPLPRRPCGVVLPAAVIGAPRWNSWWRALPRQSIGDKRTFRAISPASGSSMSFGRERLQIAGGFSLQRTQPAKEEPRPGLLQDGAGPMEDNDLIGRSQAQVSQSGSGSVWFFAYKLPHRPGGDGTPTQCHILTMWRSHHTCLHCGAEYEVTYTKTGFWQEDMEPCQVCGKELASWNSTRVPSFRLVKRPEGVNG